MIHVYKIYQKIMAIASFEESSNFSLIFPSFLFVFPKGIPIGFLFLSLFNNQAFDGYHYHTIAKFLRENTLF